MEYLFRILGLRSSVEINAKISLSPSAANKLFLAQSISHF